MDEALQRIDQLVKENPIMIFMKGTPQLPSCGFSSRAAAAMQACGVQFGYANVLADQEIYENLPRYADWPTFPQIYINGELVGGHDIIMELYQSGELKQMMEAAGKDSAEA